jgi:hypothetical protein
MSYDITFISKSAGQTWQEALDAHEARTIARQPWHAPAAAATQSEWKRLAARLLSVEPYMDQFETPHKLELTDLETGLQVSLFEDEAAITIPYGRSADSAQKVMKTARRMAQIIESETGLLGYDLQLGRRFLEPEAPAKAKRQWWVFWKKQ